MKAEGTQKRYRKQPAPGREKAPAAPKSAGQPAIKMVYRYHKNHARNAKKIQPKLIQLFVLPLSFIKVY